MRYVAYVATFKEIFEAPKEIGRFPGWSRPEEETDYVWFDAPLEIGGVAETGLVLHGGCYAHRPDVHVTMELRFSSRPGRRCIPLERLDWRSLVGGHSNKRRRCTRLAGPRVSETHLHDFYMHWSDDSLQMVETGLPCAREIDEELSSFADIAAFVGNRLRINNIEVVEEPPWVYDMFSGAMSNG